MEEILSFSDLESEIYKMSCEIGRLIITQILDECDKQLMATRDKSRYVSKSIGKTTIKSILGDIEFNRRYYYDKRKHHHIYLLDEKIGLDGEGLYSKMIESVLSDLVNDLSYERAAAVITEVYPTSLSKTGAWDIIQKIGKKIKLEQKALEKQEMCSQYREEKKTVKVLFKETDGVMLKHQLPNKKNGNKMEAKMMTVYEGWDENAPKRLVGKTVIGGMISSNKFKKKTDAVIGGIYNIDEIDLCVTNGDGAGWIDSISEDGLYQLDRFHVVKMIRENIEDDNKKEEMVKALRSKDIGELFDLLTTYINSIDGVCPKKKVKKANKLFGYLDNHKDNLLRYNERKDVTVPNPPAGMVYKNMGVQESQNCALITMRMKHKRMRWSKKGADNLINVICSRKNGTIRKTIMAAEPDLRGAFKMNNERIFSANDIAEVVGKNKYYNSFSASMPAVGGLNRGLSKILLSLSHV